ncbi:hypothetical protein KP509_11G094700 [Ceratopteris richardii]|uniref:Uncharacterized protein n=1 Tax=Ceratopteris richardii TaxID=49495 RepID=A0A8T2TRW7_CERRI|nr:hypothetical protein KP509_11G094700 [Ceratopteris richardii]
MEDPRNSISGRHPVASTDGDADESFQSGVATKPGSASHVPPAVQIHELGSASHVPNLSDSEPDNEVERLHSNSQAYKRNSSFARDLYESSTVKTNSDNPEDPIELADFMAQELRAWNRMIMMTDSQVDVLMSHLIISVEGDNTKVAKLERLLEWRRLHGDFGALASPDEEVEEVLLRIPDMPELPYDAQTWTMEMLLGYPRPDLQLECLLRGIDYDGADTKSQLVDMLMVSQVYSATHHKHSVSPTWRPNDDV